MKAPHWRRQPVRGRLFVARFDNLILLPYIGCQGVDLRYPMCYKTVSRSGSTGQVGPSRPANGYDHTRRVTL